MNEIRALIRDPRELLSHLLPCEVSAVRCSLWASKLSPDNESASILSLRLPGLQNVQRSISVVYKPPSLCYFCYSSRAD